MLRIFEHRSLTRANGDTGLIVSCRQACVASAGARIPPSAAAATSRPAAARARSPFAREPSVERGAVYVEPVGDLGALIGVQCWGAAEGLGGIRLRSSPHTLLGP